MSETDIEYAKRLRADTEAVLDEIKSVDAGARIAGAINWADLHCVGVEHRRSFYETDTVESWHTCIEEASPNAGDLVEAVMRGLIGKGHVGVNVEVEW